MVTRNAIVDVLMERDEMTRSEAIAALKEARAQVRAGADPEEVLMSEFMLESEYVYELLE